MKKKPKKHWMNKTVWLNAQSRHIKPKRRRGTRKGVEAGEYRVGGTGPSCWRSDEAELGTPAEKRRSVKCWIKLCFEGLSEELRQQTNKQTKTTMPWIQSSSFLFLISYFLFSFLISSYFLFLFLFLNYQLSSHSPSPFLDPDFIALQIRSLDEMAEIPSALQGTDSEINYWLPL